MKQTLTCIVCPNGCDIEVEILENGQPGAMTGATCKRGEAFVRQEIIDPQRTIASSVRLLGGALPLASVRLDGPVPKAMIPEVMRLVCGVTLTAPVAIGDVVLADVLGTGRSIIVTKNIPSV